MLRLPGLPKGPQSAAVHKTALLVQAPDYLYLAQPVVLRRHLARPQLVSRLSLDQTVPDREARHQPKQVDSVLPSIQQEPLRLTETQCRQLPETVLPLGMLSHRV